MASSRPDLGDSPPPPRKLGRARRPQQPPQHIIDRKATSAFKNLLPPEFWPTPPAEGKDYGWDYLVMTGRDGYVEYHFFSQVKGSDHPEYLADGKFLSHDFEVPTVLWLLDQGLPTMLAVCDTGQKDEVVYWTWLADAVAAVAATHGDGWRDQATVAIRIPLANRLTRSDRDQIADDVAIAVQ